MYVFSHRVSGISLRRAMLLLILASLLLVPTLTQPIEEVAHDAGVVHIYRGVLFSQAIADGVLYPRWVQGAHLGLGGPLFTFQSPLPFYGMALLNALGIPHPIGWRVLMALGFVVAGTGTYGLVYDLTRRWIPATVAAITFLYAPYVVRVVFDRGSNEAFSLFLYPWVLWMLLRLARRPTVPRFVLAVVAWALCIGMHVLGPLMLAPFALLVALLLAWRQRTFAPPLALLVGGMLVAFIWLPMVPELEFVHLDWWEQAPSVQPATNPIPVDMLLAPPPVYDTMRATNSIQERVGWAHIALLLLGLPLTLWAWWRRESELVVSCLLATASGLLLFWLLTASSALAWRLLDPLLSAIEFRFRLMGLLALAATLLAGALTALLRPRGQQIVGGLLSMAVIAYILPALYPALQYHHAHFEGAVSAEEVRAAELRLGGNSFTSFGENTPRWVEHLPDAAVAEAVAASPIVPEEDVEVHGAAIATQRWDLGVTAHDPTTLTLHLLYYPRWRATVNQKSVPLHPQPGTGYAQLDLPAGSHTIALRYGRTAAEGAALALSGLTLLALLAALGWTGYRGLVRREPAPVPSAMVRPRSAPPWWLLSGLAVLVLFKVAYVDPHTTWLRCTSTTETVCGATAVAAVEFVGGPTLRGYTVASSTVAAGGVLRLQLFWEGVAGLTGPLHSFVHLRHSDPLWPVNPRTGGFWAQATHDTPASLVVTAYVPGQLHEDQYHIPIPSDTPPSEYLLEIGWFDPISGEQLDVAAETVTPPLDTLWRSILLPPVTVVER